MGSGGGGGSDAPANTTQTTTVEIPDWAQPHAQNLLQRGNALSQSPYTAYEGQRVAPLTGEHELALQGITNRAIMGSPDISAARGNMANTLAGTYMNPNSNPWLAPMMEQAGNQITDHYRKGVAAQTDKAFSQGNSMGSSAYRQTVQDNQSTLARNLSEAADRLYYNNYGDERLAQQRAMTLAPQMANLDYQDAQALLGVGDVRRQYGQDILNTNLQNWTQAQQDPYRKLDVLSAAISGAVGGSGSSTSNTTGTPYQASPAAGMLGGGLLGYGLTQGTQYNPLLGAGAGSLLGGMML